MRPECRNLAESVMDQGLKWLTVWSKDRHTEQEAKKSEVIVHECMLSFCSVDCIWWDDDQYTMYRYFNQREDHHVIYACSVFVGKPKRGDRVRMLQESRVLFIPNFSLNLFRQTFRDNLRINGGLKNWLSGPFRSIFICWLDGWMAGCIDIQSTKPSKLMCSANVSLHFKN